MRVKSKHLSDSREIEKISLSVLAELNNSMCGRPTGSVAVRTFNTTTRSQDLQVTRYFLNWQLLEERLPFIIKKFNALFAGKTSPEIRLKAAAYFWTFFTLYTHPFKDGNGRVGKLYINKLLMPTGYFVENFELVDKYAPEYKANIDCRKMQYLILCSLKPVVKFNLSHNIKVVPYEK